MKTTQKTLAIVISIFLFTFNLSAQKKDKLMYENANNFYKLSEGVDIRAMNTGSNKLERMINIFDLVEGTNTDSVALYGFFTGNLIRHHINIIIVDKDSVGIYDLFAINFLLQKVVELSEKYPDVSNNKKDIKWIEAILDRHLFAMQSTPYAGRLIEKKGNYSLYVSYLGYLTYKVAIKK